MARRRKLASLDKLDGNPSNRLIVDSGIEALGEPFSPEHLMDDARGVMEVVRMSMPAGVYSALDTFLLSAFATAWAIHKRAALEISAPDFQWIVTSAKGTRVQNPWVRMLNQQAVILASLGDRLGLDPKSRMAMRLPDAKQHQLASRFGRLLNLTPKKLTN